MFDMPDLASVTIRKPLLALLLIQNSKLKTYNCTRPFYCTVIVIGVDQVASPVLSTNFTCSRYVPAAKARVSE